MRRCLTATILVVAVSLAGCADEVADQQMTTASLAETDASNGSSTMPGYGESTTVLPSTVPPTIVPTTMLPTTMLPTTTLPPTTVLPSTAPPTTLPPTTVPTTTPYVLPVADARRAGWSDTHSSYPATDIFVGCGAGIVSPVNGTVTEVRRVNSWDRAVDNPATRGGRSITVVGDDGVRYYMAHFETIVEPLAPGDRVAAGQPLGTMGDTGRASACHLHFGISPPCPGKEWSVRRGAVWPYVYFNAWRRGEQLSPVDEVRAWSAANPDACARAMADPNASFS